MQTVYFHYVLLSVKYVFAHICAISGMLRWFMNQFLSNAVWCDVWFTCGKAAYCASSMVYSQICIIKRLYISFREIFLLLLPFNSSFNHNHWKVLPGTMKSSQKHREWPRLARQSRLRWRQGGTSPSSYTAENWSGQSWRGNNCRSVDVEVTTQPYQKRCNHMNKLQDTYTYPLCRICVHR